MSYNGSGTFVVNSSGQPVVTGTVISSTAFNALTADLATGLSTAITKDGQTTTTARILFAQGVSSTLVTDATSATTGSIITAGGVSMQKALWVGTTSRHVGATQFDAAITYGGVTLSNAVTGTGNMVLGTSPSIGEPTATSASANNCVILSRTGSSAGTGRIYANSGDMFGVNDGTLYPFTVAQGASSSTLIVGTASVTVGKPLTYGGVTLSNAVTGTGNMVLSAAPTFTGTLTGQTASFVASTSGVLMTINGSTGSPTAVQRLQQDVGTLSCSLSIVSRSNSTPLPAIMWDVTNAAGETATNKFAFGASRYLGYGRGAYIWMANNANDATAVSTADEVMRLTSSGLLGIGMTPARTLDVTGTFGVTGASTLGGTLTAAAATFSGTLGVTGAATFNARISQTLTPAAAEYALRSTGQTTGWISVSLNNTGGEYVVAGENSSGNNLIIGDSAYDMVIRAPSGISFSANAGATQHMRLSSSGLLGIGMTPSNVLDITQTQNATSAIRLLNASTGTAGTSRLQVGNSFSATLTQLLTTSTGFTPSGMVRADASILLGSGAGGISIYTGAAQPIYFGINGAEVARIDTSGRLLIGMTAQTAENSMVSITPTNGSTSGIAIVAGTYNQFYQSYYFGATKRGSVQDNGLGTAVLFNTTSDTRQKTWLDNQRDFRSIICAIAIGDAEWKSSPGSRNLVIFAQQAHELYPDAVSKPENDADMWQADYSKLAPLALWGVKDLYKIIDDLTTRLAALENKS